MRRKNRVEWPRFVTAATMWGDFLFERRDYRAAADAYGRALGDQAFAGEGESPGTPEPSLTPEEQWAMYQRANAMAHLADYEGSIALFDRLAGSNSQWSKDAQAQAAAARLEQRLRGLPVSPPRNTG